MELLKATDAINRTLLCTTLYKKELPEETIMRIRRGHQGTRLSPQYRWRYGETKGGNIGVFQGSEISASCFIIYLDGMMEDLTALNRRPHLPMRIVQDRRHEQHKDILRGGANKERGRTMRRIPGNTHNQQCHNKQAAARRAQKDPIAEKKTERTKRSLPTKTGRGTRRSKEKEEKRNKG